MAFSRKGLADKPNTTRVNPNVRILWFLLQTLSTQRIRRASQSYPDTEIMRNAFSMSTIKAMG